MDKAANAAEFRNRHSGFSLSVADDSANSHHWSSLGVPAEIKMLRMCIPVVSVGRDAWSLRSFLHAMATMANGWLRTGRWFLQPTTRTTNCQLSV